MAQTEFEIPEVLPPLKTPILATTCGQSPGALMVAVLCANLGLAFENDDLITAAVLEAKCSADAEEQGATGKACYGVLFVTTGSSLKGMGAAGVSIDLEIERCVALIETAKKLGITVIVGQIEGPTRRIDESDEKSIRAISPLADLLITRSDVNEDGYFTALAEEKEIPQIFISQTLDLSVLLPLLFPAD